MRNSQMSNALTVPTENIVLKIAKNAWILFTIHIIRQMVHLKENMIVHIWPMFIHANIHVDILPKL